MLFRLLFGYRQYSYKGLGELLKIIFLVGLMPMLILLHSHLYGYTVTPTKDLCITQQMGKDLELARTIVTLEETIGKQHNTTDDNLALHYDVQDVENCLK